MKIQIELKNTNLPLVMSNLVKNIKINTTFKINYKILFKTKTPKSQSCTYYKSVLKLLKHVFIHEHTINFNDYFWDKLNLYRNYFVENSWDTIALNIQYKLHSNYDFNNIEHILNTF